MSHADLLVLFVQCAMLSLLAIGGAIAVAPDLQRQVVVEHPWMTASDFTAAMALAQAAPGPNLLFVAVVGYQMGQLPAALVALAGMLLPSSVLTLTVSRWGFRRSSTRGVRSFVTGMAPVTMGLVAATGILLAQPVTQRPTGWLLVVATVLLGWRTRISPLWLIAAGGLLGSQGWV